MEANITPEKLQQLTLPNETNVLELSKSSKVLLIFLRIFACPYCRKAINDVNEIVQSLRQLKVSVVFVHQGPEKMAREVFEAYGPRLVLASDAAKHPDRFPFYEIIDENRKFYNLFNLPLFDWNNFQRKEKPTWHKAIDRWGTCEWVGEVKQLGALFVIDKGGKVFSSMLQKGQTNIHDLAEFLNIPMDVRFLPDHTKSIVYRKTQSDSQIQSTNESQQKFDNHQQLETSTSAENVDHRKSKDHQQSALRVQFVPSIQIKEKYKEYRDFCLEALSEQRQYARTKLQKHLTAEENNNDQHQQQQQQHSQNRDNNESSNNTYDESSTHELPQKIYHSSRLLKALKCLPKSDDRPYTEEQIKEVVKNWKLNHVLEDKEIRRFFRVFLTKDLSVENILFYEDVEELLETIEHVRNKSVSSSVIVDKEDAESIALSMKTLIDEFLSNTSENMVNVDSSHVSNFQEFTQPDSVNQNLDQLEKYLRNIQDEVRINMTDPLQRFRWSIEGQRAAACILVQQ